MKKERISDGVIINLPGATDEQKNIVRKLFWEMDRSNELRDELDELAEATGASRKTGEISQVSLLPLSLDERSEVSRCAKKSMELRDEIEDFTSNYMTDEQGEMSISFDEVKMLTALLEEECKNLERAIELVEKALVKGK